MVDQDAPHGASATRGTEVMLKRKVVLAATAIALGAGGGVFAASQSGNNGDDEAREIETVRSAPVSLPQAIATAEKQSSGRAVSAEAEENGSGVVYEVTTFAGGTIVEFQIDPQSGNVVKTEDEQARDDDAEEYAGAGQLTTTLGAAIASAEQATGGKAIEAGLDDDDGKAFYQVELAAAGTIHKVYVDAASGKVVKTATGRDDENGEHEDE
jgi:uncharacterized membrane protein YkoI